MVEDDQVDGWKGRRGGGEEGWRHGNSRLAFNVRRGVPRIAAKLVRKRFKQSDEGLLPARLTCLPPSLRAARNNHEEQENRARREERHDTTGESCWTSVCWLAGSAIKTCSFVLRHHQREGEGGRKRERERDDKYDGIHATLSLTCYARSVREAATCREHASATDGP